MTRDSRGARVPYGRNGLGTVDKPGRGPPRAAAPHIRRNGNVEGEIPADEAARERGDDRARGSRQDNADVGDHDGAGEEVPEDPGAVVRFDRQRAGGEGAGDHDCDGARGVRDGQPSLRARGLSGARGLREEHDHGGGADGRGDPGGVGGGWADAADAGAHPFGAPGGGAADRGGAEQGGRGGRQGASGPGGAGGAGAVEELPVPRGRDPGGEDLGVEGDAGGRGGGEGDPEADGGGGPLHSDSGAAGGADVPDADRGRVFDLGAWDGGDGACGAGEGEGGRGDRDRRD